MYTGIEIWLRVVLKRIVIDTILFLALIVLMQDFLIFPRLWSYPMRYYTQPYQPRDGTRHVLTSPDGVSFEVFERQPTLLPAKGVAIVFHGNGETAESFYRVQEWLSSLGIASYSVEFRGYGHSGGWPTEKGLSLDAETAWDFVEKREGVSASRIIVLAHSVGTGFAAGLAASRAPGTLVLVSGYSSLKARAEEEPVLGSLASIFLHFNVPTKDYIAKLDRTCLVIVHGQKDVIMPFHHSQELLSSYKGKQVIAVFSPLAGHNDILSLEQEEISKAMFSCVAGAEGK